MRTDHNKACAMYWDVEDAKWLREAPLTDNPVLMTIFERLATRIEEQERRIEMLTRGNALLARDRSGSGT